MSDGFGENVSTNDSTKLTSFGWTGPFTSQVTGTEISYTQIGNKITMVLPNVSSNGSTGTIPSPQTISSTTTVLPQRLRPGSGDIVVVPIIVKSADVYTMGTLTIDEHGVMLVKANLNPSGTGDFDDNSDNFNGFPNQHISYISKSVSGEDFQP